MLVVHNNTIIVVVTHIQCSSGVVYCYYFRTTKLSLSIPSCTKALDEQSTADTWWFSSSDVHCVSTKLYWLGNIADHVETLFESVDASGIGCGRRPVWWISVICYLQTQQLTYIFENMSAELSVLPISPNCSRHSITSCLWCCLARSTGVLPSCICVKTITADVMSYDMHTCSDVFNVCRVYSI